MRTKTILSVIFLVFVLTACNPSRREMPITTSSEEVRELFKRGRDLRENGEHFIADTILNQAIELDPDFALAHLYLYMGVGINQALSLTDKVTEGERLLIKATEAHYFEDRQLARLTTDSLLKLYPRDKYCLYFASTVYYRQDPEKGIELLYRAIHLDRYYMGAYNLLGYYLKGENRYEEAEQVFIQYLELWPKSANTQHSFAELIAEKGDDKEALKQFRRVLLLDPSYTYAHVNIAWIHIRLGEYEKARQYCEEFYEKVPTEKEKEWAMCMLANVHFIQGDLSAALETMDRQISRLKQENNYVNLINAVYIKGMFALRGGRYQVAVEIFTDGLEVYKDDYSEIRNYNLGLLFLHGGLSIANGLMKNQIESAFHLEKAQSYFQSIGKEVYFRGLLSSIEAAHALNNGDFDAAISDLQIPARGVSVASQYYLA